MNQHTEYAELSERFGSSFYLVDPSRFRDNLARLRTAFQRYYPRTALAYSYKTNYLPLFCQIARDSGAYAEVVSPLEYEMAVRLGNPPNRIIFNGPVKPIESISEALAKGSIVHLDSVEEYEQVERLARDDRSRRFRIGLRCESDQRPEAESRFGIQTRNGDLDSVFNRAGAIGNLEVNSLHLHSSRPRTAASFATRAEHLIEIWRQYGKKGTISTLDLGGGLYGSVPKDLASQLATAPPSYAEYAEAVGPLIARAFAEVERPPELVLEPGVGVVGDAVSFVCRVESVKVGDNRNIANSTGSVQNIRPGKSLINSPMRVVRQDPSRAAASRVPFDVGGFTCLEDDYLYHGYPEELSIGDYLRFDNVGAYSISFKPQFIRGAPAILYQDRPDGEWLLARRRETVDDIFATFMIPGEAGMGHNESESEMGL